MTNYQVMTTAKNGDSKQEIYTQSELLARFPELSSMVKKNRLRVSSWVDKDQNIIIMEMR